MNGCERIQDQRMFYTEVSTFSGEAVMKAESSMLAQAECGSTATGLEEEEKLNQWG